MQDNIEYPQIKYRYDIIDMREIDYKQFLVSDIPEEIILSILCDYKGLSANLI